MKIYKTCDICNINIVHSGYTCSLECGKKYQQKNILKKFEPTKQNKDIENGIYINQNVNIVNEMKEEIFKFKNIPQEKKQLFFKNRIIPMLNEINGSREEWNAICTHLKNHYKAPEYKFIINAFKQVGMVIY
jgi:hypothetical protein